MLYAAKRYWPGVIDSDLHQVAERAGGARLAPGTGTVNCPDNAGRLGLDVVRGEQLAREG